MPFRPIEKCRQNVYGVIYPLTAAIRHVYGLRPSDQAWPLGAFYTINIDNKVWLRADEIWYVPRCAEKVNARKIDKEIVDQFVHAIISGSSFKLRSGKIVSWDPIPQDVSLLLPAVLFE